LRSARRLRGLGLRLGSLEPRIITQEFCETISDIKGFCPHFHLSLQSGCDETLKRMGRRYDTARFYESVKLLREHFDNCGISADLITGFPGETEEEFNKLLNL
jgi:threonylcarbamoyladenosine tRNA methylthiotransferase MtaB